MVWESQHNLMMNEYISDTILINNIYQSALNATQHNNFLSLGDENQIMWCIIKCSMDIVGKHCNVIIYGLISFNLFIWKMDTATRDWLHFT